MPPPKRKRTPRPPPPVNPRFDPRLNAFPLPPGWAMVPGRRTMPLGLSYGYPLDFGNGGPVGYQPHDPGWGRSGWGWGEGGHPGMEGDLNIGEAKAPLTGGWVYGLQNWYPGPDPYARGGGPGVKRRA